MINLIKFKFEKKIKQKTRRTVTQEKTIHQSYDIPYTLISKLNL